VAPRREPHRHRLRHLVFQNRRHAPELLLDRLRPLHEHLEHAIRFSLRVQEVVAPHHGRTLELPIDSAIALLEPGRVPRQVEVEQVGAMVLQVNALAGSIGRNEDAQRVFCRVRLECPLDLLAEVIGHAPVERRDALVGAVRPRYRRAELLVEVPLRVGVLREQHDSLRLPRRSRLTGRSRSPRDAFTQLLFQPADEKAHPRIRQAPSRICKHLHGNAATEALCIQDFHQCGEAVRQPVVRRGRQEQAVLEPRRDIAHDTGEVRINRIPISRDHRSPPETQYRHPPETIGHMAAHLAAYLRDHRSPPATLDRNSRRPLLTWQQTLRPISETIGHLVRHSTAILRGPLVRGQQTLRPISETIGHPLQDRTEYLRDHRSHGRTPCGLSPQTIGHPLQDRTEYLRNHW
jgi:hypothetical protein